MTPTELSKACGISVPYACQILSVDGKSRRVPPRALAIHIFRKTGWRHEMLDGLSDETIATLEAVEPWVRPADREKAA